MDVTRSAQHHTMAPVGLFESAPSLRTLDLTGLGSLAVRDSGPPTDRPDAPVVFLLHGWWVDADLNWCRSFGSLTDRFRVVAWDHRGHGRHGLRGCRRFRLEDCADDAVAVADALGIETFTVVGYSLGGAVAQLVARRHPQRVSGLILCATALTFTSMPGLRRQLRMLRLVAPAARLVGDVAWKLVWRIADLRGGLGVGDDDVDSLARGVIRQGDLRLLLGAGAALGGFDARDWAPDLTVASAVVVCTMDGVIPTADQRHLAEALPALHVEEVAADHLACITAPDRFLPALRRALDAVTEC